MTKAKPPMTIGELGITPEIVESIRHFADKGGSSITDFVPFILGVGIGAIMEDRRNNERTKYYAPDDNGHDIGPGPDRNPADNRRPSYLRTERPRTEPEPTPEGK